MNDPSKTPPMTPELQKALELLISCSPLDSLGYVMVAGGVANTYRVAKYQAAFSRRQAADTLDAAQLADCGDMPLSVTDKAAIYDRIEALEGKLDALTKAVKPGAHNADPDAIPGELAMWAALRSVTIYQNVLGDIVAKLPNRFSTCSTTPRAALETLRAMVDGEKKP